MERLSTDLEGLYRTMVADYHAGALPRPDLTNLEAYLEVGALLDHEGQEMAAATDYADLWKAALGRRHLARPLAPDGRLWRQADIDAVEPPTPAVEAAPSPCRLRAAGGRR